jgi:hypothetical protein
VKDTESEIEREIERAGGLGGVGAWLPQTLKQAGKYEGLHSQRTLTHFDPVLYLPLLLLHHCCLYFTIIICIIGSFITSYHSKNYVPCCLQSMVLRGRQ